MTNVIAVDLAPDQADRAIARRSNELFEAHQHVLYDRTDRLFAGLLILEWLGGIVAALLISPKTWAGAHSSVHPHVITAAVLGFCIMILPVCLVALKRHNSFTRHAIAVAQLLFSALFIHISGGRVETHFHVFGSLAFLAIYRDWRVLITATVVVATDHWFRGTYYPQSVYGISTPDPWRWVEHASWVIFEDIFLIWACVKSVAEMRGICDRDARLEAHGQDLERQVEARTADLVAANSKLEALATTDPLTGLANHRSMVSLLDQELERSRRYGRTCCLLFLDLDHFKALNDRYHHAAGDAALCEFAKVIKRSLRGIDTVGRWGGEEFLAVLPEIDEAHALESAERVRTAVAAHLFEAGGGLHLTCSVGVAMYPNDSADRSGLVEGADRAMYAAKSMGRNQVRAFSDPAVSLSAEGAGSSREEAAMVGIVNALVDLVEARDFQTGKHSEDVADLAEQVAIELGMDRAAARNVGVVGKLHDVGKVAMPDALLQKAGSLSELEWELMKRHPIIGADVVCQIPSLRMLGPAIRGHHERWDGKGYPDGLAQEEIPIAARIVCAVDAFSAMTNDRPYQVARDWRFALRELQRCAGSQFDERVVQALETILERREGEEHTKAA
ncbi:MAG TPA: diguanylate cyclase [Chthonomonadales bacterium]|nr:diguanylate cyclase [Chthonomonadales bacterium]